MGNGLAFLSVVSSNRTPILFTLLSFLTTVGLRFREDAEASGWVRTHHAVRFNKSGQAVFVLKFYQSSTHEKILGAHTATRIVPQGELLEDTGLLVHTYVCIMYFVHTCRMI